MLAQALVEAGVVVMSGLAEGVDTAAMTAAIEAGGHTVCVIGTPLDKDFPAANARLQERVYRNHLVVSQFGTGSQECRPRRRHLLQEDALHRPRRHHRRALDRRGTRCQ